MKKSNNETVVLVNQNKQKQVDQKKIITIANMFMMQDGLMGSIGMGSSIPNELAKLSKEDRRKAARKARKMRKKAIRAFRHNPKAFPKKKYLTEKKDDDLENDRHVAQSLMYDMYRNLAKEKLGLV